MTKQNPRITAEFHYWVYGEFSETAMDSHPEVEEEELKRIARKYEVILSARGVSATFWRLSRIGSFPEYSKIIVEVKGYNEESIKRCISEIFNVYGRPDEIPTPFFGEKRMGKRVIDNVLREPEKFW